MAHTLAVKAHGRVATHRRGGLKIDLTAGSSRRQVGQGVHAAPVGGELGDLLAGDYRTDFAMLRLHPYGIGFNCNGLRRGAQLQIEVNAGAITYVQHDVILLRHAESRSFGLDAVVTDWKIGEQVLASITGLGASNLAGFDVGCRDGYVGNHRSRWIGNGANHSGSLSGRAKRQAQHQNGEKQQGAYTPVLRGTNKTSSACRRKRPHSLHPFTVTSRAC